MKSRLAITTIAGLVGLFAALPASASEMREIDAARLLVIETNRGTIYVEMNPDIAPGHVERIRQLAGEGFYDGVKWHRVIDGFMAQTGDPTGTGEGGSTLGNLKAELTFRRGEGSGFKAVAQPSGSQLGFMDTVPVVTQPDRYWLRSSDQKVHAWASYCPGVAGMARGDAEDSADSQFFLMRDAYPSLDKRYSIWGRVVSGQSVVNALKDSPLSSGIVEDPDVMIRVRAGDQIAPDHRPVVRVMNTGSEQFARHVQQVRQARGADFSLCDIEFAAEVSAPAQ